MKINNYDDVLAAKKTCDDLEVRIWAYYHDLYVGKKFKLTTGTTIYVSKVRWGVEPVHRKEIICTLFGTMVTAKGRTLKGLRVADETCIDGFVEPFKTDYAGKPKATT